MAMNSTEVSLECGKFRTRCVTPRRSNTGQHDGFKQSPQTFSRGNLSRSRTSVCKPARAQNAAQLDPAGPPPITATSKISIRRTFTEGNEDNEGFSGPLFSLLPSVRNLSAVRLWRHWRAIQYQSKLTLMSRSLRIFRNAGIQLRIHSTFLLLIGWLAFGYY